MLVDATSWLLSDGSASGTLVAGHLANGAADTSAWERVSEGSAILELIPDVDTLQVSGTLPYTGSGTLPYTGGARCDRYFRVGRVSGSSSSGSSIAPR